jgi:hypothetical protein
LGSDQKPVKVLEQNTNTAIKETAPLKDNYQINSQKSNEDDYSLSTKQIEYALTLISKLNGEYELAIDPNKLTVKDLNRLIAYFRYKNKGTLINLVKKGVLKRGI